MLLLCEHGIPVHVLEGHKGTGHLGFFPRSDSEDTHSASSLADLSLLKMDEEGGSCIAVCPDRRLVG